MDLLKLKLNKHIVITGHYGCGKTNIAIALACSLSERGKRIALVDLDIVNPYFRAADSVEELESKGIKVIASQFANTNLDVPSAPLQIGAAFSENFDNVIFDVGGDDDGATVLGVYREKLQTQGYTMLYVINMYRLSTAEVDQAYELLYLIEQKSGLKCAGLINNSNLGAETVSRHIEESEDYAKRLSERTGLPIVFTSVMDFVKGYETSDDTFYIKQSTKTYF